MKWWMLSQGTGSSGRSSANVALISRIFRGLQCVRCLWGPGIEKNVNLSDAVL